MLQRFLYLFKTYLLTVMFFVMAKVVFMLCYFGVKSFYLGDIPEVLRHGLTLDLSTALYFIAVPLLCTAISVYLRNARPLLVVQKVYYALVSFAFSLAFVADTSLYEFWGFKLDASSLQYLETPVEAMASVTTGYLVVRLLLVIAVGILFFTAYCMVMPKERKGLRRASSREKAVETAIYVLSIPAIVIGIRGGLDESTTNIGQVYYSQNQFLNHSAVNPVFSFVASFEKTASQNTEYHFYDADELEQLTATLYDSETVAGDTLLTTQRPDVVVVLLESCGNMFLEVMPNLRRAADEGIDFTNCYGNSYRTDRGTVCALSGYLSFPTMSVMKMSGKVAHLSSIAKSLLREGYTTEYLYGGDINFTKMKGYLISTGFQKLRWKEDYTREEQNTSKWGVRDDITFKTLGEMVRSHDDGHPFLIGFSTLSSHEPWDVPVSKYEEKQFNGFYYVDQCIGTFLDEMKRSPRWQNLLVVFMPDHSSDFRDITEQHPDRNRIPMIWTGGAVKSARKLDMICNQSDFAATLLGQMGIGHADFRFSRDVTSSSYQYPFAIHMFNNGISMTDSTGFMLYDLTARSITVSTSAEAQRMERTAKAILQMASEDLSSK